MLLKDDHAITIYNRQLSARTISMHSISNRQGAMSELLASPFYFVRSPQGTKLFLENRLRSITYAIP